MRMGVSCLRRGDTVNAHDYFMECVRIDPTYPEAHNKLAAMYHKVGVDIINVKKYLYILILLYTPYLSRGSQQTSGHVSQGMAVATLMSIFTSLLIYPVNTHILPLSTQIVNNTLLPPPPLLSPPPSHHHPSHH